MKNAQTIISSIQALDLSKVSFVELVQIVQRIGDIAINQITIPKNSYIVRSRCEEKFIPINNVRDISIRTDIENIKPGRCNWYGTPVFYGVIPFFEKGKKEAEGLCINEASKILQSKEDFPEEYATVSIWDVTENIPVAGILTHEDFVSVNPAMADFYRMFLENVKTLSDPDYFLSLAKYVSGLFAAKLPSNNPIQYALTSAFSHIYYGIPQIDGILYPSASARGEGNGLNVALRPDAMNKLKFNRAMMYRHQRSTQKNVSFIQPYMITTGVNNGGKLSWEPVTPSYGANFIQSYFDRY